MTNIMSNLGGARQKATALRTACDHITQNSSVDKDTRTTVAGNTNAHDTIQTIIDSAEQIAQAVLTASSQLQSVAEEFEALDQSVATSLKGGGKLGAGGGGGGVR